ncbi:calcium-binding protein [Argonema antarcticum]|uniref:calcium-binding protein n=1 Tax=Argonema antarcticum TaxID=2942763 RepID=UPI002013B42C|nr:calcium-binding protein [Argonema antarcticum]MCL1471930.1 hypothetical protein [Argonema antarcticum A004/B2]
MPGPTPDGFYDLSFGDDDFLITPGLLAGLPRGLRALDGNDTIQGSQVAEIVNGNLGNDYLFGAGGDDFLQGGKGQDVLMGDDGNDLLNGNIGEDLIYAGIGNDTVRGGKDSDLLMAEDGDDVLIGDFGADLLTGGAGSDLFILRTDTVLIEGEKSADLILDFNKFSDRIGITGGLTEANVVIRQQDLPIAEALNNPLLAGLGLSVEFIVEIFELLTGVDVDPNRDGIISGTAIEINGGTPLGFVVNALPTDVQGHIFSVPDV